MTNNEMINRTLLCAIFLVLCGTLTAQTVKPVTLTDKVPFTDSPVLQSNTEGTDLSVALMFDEDANALTVTLHSGRRLFVFWDDICYSKAFSCRKLRTDKLPYTITGNTSDCFRRVWFFAKALPRPRCRHIFHTWASAEGLQPVREERKMVNDSITTSFVIPDNRTDISLRLRDILLLEEVKQSGISRTYEMSYGGDINIEYKITLQRNPCLKMEEQIDAAGKALTAAERSYRALEQAYPKRVINRQEDMDMFCELKSALQLQFPVNNDSSACTRIMELRGQYNLYADSISSFDVSLNIPIDPLTNKTRKLDTKTVLYNARQLDSNVSRWLTTNDPVEQADLKEQSEDIIEDTNELIHSSVASTKDEQDAVTLFREAEQYFRKTCRK